MVKEKKQGTKERVVKKIAVSVARHYVNIACPIITFQPTMKLRKF